MEDHDVVNTTASAVLEELQVSEAAVEVAVEEKFEIDDVGGGAEHGVVAVTVGNGGEAELGSKRKRGRPRKQAEEVRQQFMVLPEYSPTGVKRGRGRPRGSGKWQTLAASLGCNIAGDSSAGSNFTPYTITIQAGENIVERIWSFSQVIPDSICILSASGTISTAEIFLPASRIGILRYEGRFTIVYLNGSHTYDERRGGKKCVLSVQFANSEGRFYGGAVAGSLIAAAPTQIVIATFRQPRPRPRPRQHMNIITRPQYWLEVEPANSNNNKGAFCVPLQTESVKVVTDGEVKSVIESPDNTEDASPTHDSD